MPEYVEFEYGKQRYRLFNSGKVHRQLADGGWRVVSWRNKHRLEAIKYKLINEPWITTKPGVRKHEASTDGEREARQGGSEEASGHT